MHRIYVVLFETSNIVTLWRDDLERDESTKIELVTSSNNSSIKLDVRSSKKTILDYEIIKTKSYAFFIN